MTISKTIASLFHKRLLEKEEIQETETKTPIDGRILLDALGKCIREYDHLLETISLLSDANYFSEDVLSIFLERGIKLDGQESKPILYSKNILRQCGKLGPKDCLICEKCNIQVELYGDEKMDVIEEEVWFYDGCPYCGNNNLRSIPG